MSAILNKLLKGQNVEWRTIEQIFHLRNGYTPSKSNEAYWTNGTIPWFRMEDIRENGNILDSALQQISESAVKGNKLFPKNSFIIATSATIGEHALITVPYLANQRFTNLSLKDDFINRFNIYFLYYYLFKLDEWCRNNTTMSSFASVDMNGFRKFEIPIPPLNVQEEIVRILDAFTAVTAELTAELNMREKQYQYYRNKLLSFSEAGIETDSNRQQQTALCEGLANNVKQNHQIIWKSLGEVAEYSKSRISFDKLNEKNYIGVDNLLQNRMGKTNSSYLPTSGNLTAYFENDILIGNIRPYLKKIWQANQIGGTNGDVLVIHLKDKNILPRYLYQILADDKFFDFNMQNAKGAKMPRGNKEAILKYSFPVPPLDEQKRIVNILDKFEALTHSITEGLPKEITLREQQYEYYREQLIDFPKN